MATQLGSDSFMTWLLLLLVVVVFDLNTLEALNYIGPCFVFGFAWVFARIFFWVLRLGLAFVGIQKSPAALWRWVFAL